MVAPAIVVAIAPLSTSKDKTAFAMGVVTAVVESPLLLLLLLLLLETAGRKEPANFSIQEENLTSGKVQIARR